MELADVNGDGRVDVISGNTVWLATGNGTFDAPRNYWLGGTTLFRVRDVNGDQRPDIISAISTSQSVRVLLHR